MSVTAEMDGRFFQTNGIVLSHHAIGIQAPYLA